MPASDPRARRDPDPRARRAPDPRARRDPESGVTLVEMLVVLTLVGVAAGAVGLALGSLGGGVTAREAAELLASRMRLASEEAWLSGAPAALVWDAGGYRFVVARDGGWAPHPVPLLGAARALPEGLAFGGAGGTFAVTASALPAGDQALRLTVAGPREAWDLVWDGATAQVVAPPP